MISALIIHAFVNKPFEDEGKKEHKNGGEDETICYNNSDVHTIFDHKFE